MGCSCVSGLVGEACNVDESSSCSPLPSLSPLSTEPVAELKISETLISSNHLTLVITSPAREGRFFEYISLNMVPSCSYPGSFFTKGFSAFPDCFDSFTGNFSIPELVQTCSFSEVPSADSLELQGKIHVAARDPVAVFRGNQIFRSTHSVLQISLQLPTKATLFSSNLTLTAPIEALMAVTSQEYNYLSDTAVVELTSSVQWPYYLFSPAAVSLPQPFNLSLSIGDSSCPHDVADSPCLQVSTFTLHDIRTESMACDFSGLYQIELEYGCRSGIPPSECPLSTPLALGVNFTLNSGDICGSLELVSGLSGELRSFSGATFEEERLAFVIGETIFLLASFSADVSILDVQLKNVRLIQGTGIDILMDRNTVPPYNGTFELDEEAPGANVLGFSFEANESIDWELLDPSGSGVYQVVVEATFDLSYQTTFGKKRELVVEPFTASAPLLLSAS